MDKEGKQKKKQNFKKGNGVERNKKNGQVSLEYLQRMFGQMKRENS